MSELALEDAEEYTQALAQVVAGGWRQIALGDRLGVPAVLGMTTREWVEQRLGGYVRLSVLERREAARELTEEGMTQRQIGDVLGVSAPTVSRDVSNETTTADELANEDPPEAEAVSFETRIAELPDDLVTRVQNDGMDLNEAEHVVAQREKRIAAEIKWVRDALDRLGRMAGYPVPADLSNALTNEERVVLAAVLGAIPERRDRDRSANAA